MYIIDTIQTIDHRGQARQTSEYCRRRLTWFLLAALYGPRNSPGSISCISRRISYVQTSGASGLAAGRHRDEWWCAYTGGHMATTRGRLMGRGHWQDPLDQEGCLTRGEVTHRLWWPRDGLWGFIIGFFGDFGWSLDDFVPGCFGVVCRWGGEAGGLSGCYRGLYAGAEQQQQLVNCCRSNDKRLGPYRHHQTQDEQTWNGQDSFVSLFICVAIFPLKTVQFQHRVSNCKSAFYCNSVHMLC